MNIRKIPKPEPEPTTKEFKDLPDGSFFRLPFADTPEALYLKLGNERYINTFSFHFKSVRSYLPETTVIKCGCNLDWWEV